MKQNLSKLKRKISCCIFYHILSILVYFCFTDYIIDSEMVNTWLCKIIHNSNIILSKITEKK